MSVDSHDDVDALLDAGDAIGALSAALRSAGARCTMDRRRNVTHPCWRCGTTERPRDLIAIGTYTRLMGGGIQPGDAIKRPLCAECIAATEVAR